MLHTPSSMTMAKYMNRDVPVSLVHGILDDIEGLFSHVHYTTRHMAYVVLPLSPNFGGIPYD